VYLLLDSIRKAEIAGKGKSEENLVKGVLESLKARLPYMDFARRPDARAGRGVGAQPSDFEALVSGTQFEIEVKSTKSINTIPYKNLSQLGMLRRRRMAGAKVIILIYRARERAWCVPDFDWLLETHRPEERASWNLSELKLYPTVGVPLTKALGLGELIE